MKALRLAMIALVACTMMTFTSCKDNNGGDDPNNPTSGLKEGTAKVTFGEISWEPKMSEARVLQAQDGTEYIVIRLYSVDLQTKPFVIMTIGTATGKHMASTDPALSFDYFDSQFVRVEGIDGYFGDWWAGNTIQAMGTASFNITAFDAGSLTISMEGSGDVWNVPQYSQGNTVTKAYKVEANKYKMSPMASKGGDKAYNGSVEGQPVFVF